MTSNVLDHIVEESLDQSENLRHSYDSVDGSLSDDNSSISIQDSEALRLDTPDAVPVNKSQEKQLFYREDNESEFHSETSVNPPVPFLDRKRVRFNKRVTDEADSDKESALRPWEFKRAIRRGFREKLPNNYQIKRWKRPSRIMVGSVVQLLETNAESAMERVFKKYSSELRSTEQYDDNEISKIFRQKQSIMNDIVSKIKTQLKKSRFPSRISDRDLEIEYIVSKRRFIQKRYAEELINAERLEKELLKEQSLLEEVKVACANVKENNRNRLTERLIDNNLHPSLNNAMENAYGLITDSSRSQPDGQLIYRRDVAELNLKIPGELISQSVDYEKLSNLLPALENCNRVSQGLHKNMSAFEQRDLKLILQKLFSKKLHDDSNVIP